jgi:hypothetical protein
MQQAGAPVTAFSLCVRSDTTPQQFAPFFRLLLAQWYRSNLL